MQASNVQTLSRSAAYDALQSVIVELASRPPVARQLPRTPEFKNLVEQALEAYRNYMRALDQDKAN